VAAGHEADPWRDLGERLGEAFQVADDLRDAAGKAEDLGKPVGRDAALDRMSAARELGIDGALMRLDDLVDEAVASIPRCPGASELRTLIRIEAQRFLPKELVRVAA
jgi:geranylgeranyl diphosphate synthase type II